MDTKKRTKMLRKNYKVLFEGALIMALALFIAAMKIDLPDKKAKMDFAKVKEIVHIKNVQRTVQKPTVPPVKQPSVIVEVPDDIIINDLITNLNIDDWKLNPKFSPPLLNTHNNSDDERIFVSVQKMPELLNKKTFYRGLKYPEKCKLAELEGTVYIQFVVTETGNIINAKVLQGIGNPCDEYALNYLLNNAKFSIGRQRGIPVSVKFTIPITFNLN